MTNTTNSRYDAAGRPVIGRDGPYSETPDQIRVNAERMARKVIDGTWPVTLLAAYFGDSVDRCQWKADLLAETRAAVA